MSDTPNASISACTCSIKTFKENVYPPCYLLIFFIGLTGNLISLYYFVLLYKRKRHFTSGTLYMVNLLVSDLMLVCSLPPRAAYYLNGSTWELGFIQCQITSYLLYINMYSSIFFLTVLSVMRYLAVTRPFTYYRLQNSRSAWVICFLIWLFVSLASAPLLKDWSSPDSKNDRSCLDLQKSATDAMAILNMVTLVVGFILPLFVIVFCYIFVVRSLVKPRVVQQNKTPNYKKSCALVVMVMIIFVVCFLPYHVVRTVFLQAEQDFITNGCRGSCWYIEKIRKAAVVAHCLAAGNSCLDPLLFSFMNNSFCRFCGKDAKKLSKRKNEMKPANVSKPEQEELKTKEGDP